MKSTEQPQAKYLQRSLQNKWNSHELQLRGPHNASDYDLISGLVNPVTKYILAYGYQY